MSQAQAGSGEPAVRASDAERDQATEILRTAYAEGRLTPAELDERTGAAYAAKTRADLRGLTSDLPGTVPAEAAYSRPHVADLPVADPGPGAGMHPSMCLLLCLLVAFPPAGIAYGIYWILAARRQPPAFPGNTPALPGAEAAS
jgi:hypothetical protein